MLNVYEELGETSRQLILAELRTGAKNVSDLVSATSLKQPNVSNHLARMRQKGIVRAHKIGRQVFYSLGSTEVEAVVNAAFTQTDGSPADINTEDFAKQFARAAVAGDETHCSEVIDSAFRSNLSLLDLYQDVLGPAMAMVGTWFKVEAIDEAQEHMASAITERMMARAVQVTGPARRNGKVAVLGCAENCWHVIGIRMISDYLRMNGWKTLYLGANVPRASFVSTVEQHAPDMVMLSVASADGVEATLRLITDLVASRRSHSQTYTIGVGGAAVKLNPDEFDRSGADFCPRDLRTFALHYLPHIERTGRVPHAETGVDQAAG